MENEIISQFENDQNLTHIIFNNIPSMPLKKFRLARGDVYKTIVDINGNMVMSKVFP